MSQVTTEIAWLKSLLQEIKVSWLNTLIVWCDNTSVEHMASNVIFHNKTKHREINVHYVGNRL